MIEARGAYILELHYGGEKYTKWCVDGRIDEAGERLVDMVIELWGLPDCREIRDELYYELDWELVPREELPGPIYERLVNHESDYVEVNYEY